MAQAPPGWYADPSGAPGQRYFDGTTWTQWTSAADAGSAPQVGSDQQRSIGALRRGEAGDTADAIRDFPESARRPGPDSGSRAPRHAGNARRPRVVSGSGRRNGKRDWAGSRRRCQPAALTGIIRTMVRLGVVLASQLEGESG